MLKIILTAALTATIAATSQAQVIASFNQLSGDNYGGVWVDAAAISINAGIATIGSPALGDGNFEYANTDTGTIAIAPSLSLQYIARVDSGNLSNSFTIRLADSEGTYVYNAVIVTTSWISGEWVTGSTALTPSGSGNANDINFFTITGDGSANAFRMSFDQVAAVPEPASYAALAGMATLGLALVRRRRVRAV